MADLRDPNVALQWQIGHVTGHRIPAETISGIQNGYVLDSDLTNPDTNPPGTCRVVVPAYSQSVAFGPISYPGTVSPPGGGVPGPGNPGGTLCIVGFIPPAANSPSGISCQILNFIGFGGGGGGGTGFAPLNSPHFIGIPTAPTAAPLTDDTQLATTAYSDEAVAVETARAEAAEAVLSARSPYLAPVSCVGGEFAINLGDNGGLATPTGPPLAPIDDYTLQQGDRFLLVTPGGSYSQNGIWVVNYAGFWTRPSDFASGSSFSAAAVVVQNGYFRGGTVWSCTAPTGMSIIIDTDVQAWFNAAHTDPSVVYMADWMDPTDTYTPDPTTYQDGTYNGADPFFYLTLVQPSLPKRTITVTNGTTYTGNIGTIEWPTGDWYVGMTHGSPDTGPWVRHNLNGAQLWYVGGDVCCTSTGWNVIDNGPPNFQADWATIRTTGGWNNGLINGTYAAAKAANPYGPIGYNVDGGEGWTLNLDIQGFAPALAPTVIPLPASNGNALPSGPYSICITNSANSPSSSQDGFPSAVQQVSVNGSQIIEVQIPPIGSPGNPGPGNPNGYTVWLATGASSNKVWAAGNTHFTQMAAANTGAYPTGEQSIGCAPGYNVLIDSTYTLNAGVNPPTPPPIGWWFTSSFNWLERSNINSLAYANLIGVLFQGSTTAPIAQQSFAYSRYNFRFNSVPGGIGVMMVQGAWLYNQDIFTVGGVLLEDNLGNPGYMICAGDPSNPNMTGGALYPSQLASNPNATGYSGLDHGDFKMRFEVQPHWGTQHTSIGPGPSTVVGGNTYYGAGSDASTWPAGANVVLDDNNTLHLPNVNGGGGNIAFLSSSSSTGFTRVTFVGLSTITGGAFGATTYNVLTGVNVHPHATFGILGTQGSYAYLLGATYSASYIPGNASLKVPTNVFVANDSSSTWGACYMTNLTWAIWGGGGSSFRSNGSRPFPISGSGLVMLDTGILGQDSSWSGAGSPDPYTTRVEKM